MRFSMVKYTISNILPKFQIKQCMKEKNKKKISRVKIQYFSHFAENELLLPYYRARYSEHDYNKITTNLHIAQFSLIV